MILLLLLRRVIDIRAIYLKCVIKAVVHVKEMFDLHF